MPELPAHASPALKAQTMTDRADLSIETSHHDSAAPPPPALLSPAFTPPSTPGTGTPAQDRDAPSIPLDVRVPLPRPRLLDSLPIVNCIVRARIPTTTGQEMFLHLYENNVDNKEHLAIVFGQNIRSRSLDAERPGETEKDRMIRGAYVGRLYPGRTTSRIQNDTGTASPLLKSMHKPTPVPATSIGQSAASARTPHAATADTASDILHGTSAASRAPKEPQAPLVRIHSECYTGETVWSARCDCGEQLDEAARLMSLPSAAESGGVIVYLRQEGRGIGLGEKLKAYNLQDLGADTVEANLLLRHPADARSYGLATAMLVDLGLGSENAYSTDTATIDVHPHPGTGIRLLTNNPDKVRAVEGPNREIIVKERVAMVPLAWKTGGLQGIHSEEVGNYLKTKIERMGHMLQMG